MTEKQASRMDATKWLVVVMAAVIAAAKERGATAMTLEVRPSNAPARALYAHYGFREAGVRKKYYHDNGEDAIIMWNTKL